MQTWKKLDGSAEYAVAIDALINANDEISRSGMPLSQSLDSLADRGDALISSSKYAVALAFPQKGFYRCIIAVRSDCGDGGLSSIADSLKELGAPVLVELMHGASVPSYMVSMPALLESIGFSPYSTEERLVAYANSLELAETSSDTNDDVEIYYSSKSDIEPALALWDSSLKPFQTGLPSAAEVEKAALEYRVIVAREKGEAPKVIGALYIDENASSRTFGPVAVSRDSRGKGTAALLYEKGLADAKENGIGRVFAWVEDANAPSMALHAKMGFNPDGNVCQGYLFNPSAM